MKDKLLNINNDLLKLVDHEYKLKINRVYNNFDKVAAFLFTKSTKTFRALNQLCVAGYGEDGAILVRSILENLVNLAYIEKEDSNFRATLFIYYGEWNNKQKINNLDNQRFQTNIKEFEKIKNLYNSKEIKDVIDSFLKMCEEQITKTKKAHIKYKIRKSSWSLLSLKDMAIETNLENPYYDDVYWMISQLSHPNANASKSYVSKGVDCDYLMSDIPSEMWVEESLALGFDCYSKILRIINSIFKLNMDEKIKEIEDGYIEIFKSNI